MTTAVSPRDAALWMAILGLDTVRATVGMVATEDVDYEDVNTAGVRPAAAQRELLLRAHCAPRDQH